MYDSRAEKITRQAPYVDTGNGLGNSNRRSGKCGEGASHFCCIEVAHARNLSDVGVWGTGDPCGDHRFEALYEVLR